MVITSNFFIYSLCSTSYNYVYELILMKKYPTDFDQLQF